MFNVLAEQKQRHIYRPCSPRCCGELCDRWLNAAPRRPDSRPLSLAVRLWESRSRRLYLMGLVREEMNARRWQRAEPLGPSAAWAVDDAV